MESVIGVYDIIWATFTLSLAFGQLLVALIEERRGQGGMAA